MSGIRTLRRRLIADQVRRRSKELARQKATMIALASKGVTNPAELIFVAKMTSRTRGKPNWRILRTEDVMRDGLKVAERMFHATKGPRTRAA